MKISVPTGAKTRPNKFDLGSLHITTADFGQLRPINILETIPGDKFNIDMSNFIRMSPLAVPTFGHLKSQILAFWVPMHTCFKGWSSFITEELRNSDVLHVHPSITNDQLCYMFSNRTPEDSSMRVIDIGHYTSLELLEREMKNRMISQSIVAYTWNEHSDLVNVDGFDVTNHDYSLVNTDGTTSFYKLSWYGRLYLKILQSLGYSINWTFQDKTKMSLLPLWACGRINIDYIIPERFKSEFDELENWFETNYVDFATIDDRQGSTDVLFLFLRSFLVMYEDNFYSNAWQDFMMPTSEIAQNAPYFENPNNSSPQRLFPFGGGAFNRVSVGGQSVEQMSGNDYAKWGSQANGYDSNSNSSVIRNYSTLSAYALRAMQSVADYMQAKGILGTRFYERMQAIFGFSPKEYHHDYSVFIKAWTDDVQISDVTATTDAYDNGSLAQQLGDQGGKGIISGQGHSLKFEADDYGFIIFYHRLLPVTSFYQGRKPWTKLKSPLDYYNGRFDGMGMSPIANDELFADYKATSDYNNGQNYGGNPSGVFGFAPMYHGYKHGFDYLTGDFRLGIGAMLKSYHMFRELPLPAPAKTPPVAQVFGQARAPLSLDLDFMTINPSDYDRIFSEDTYVNDFNSTDHFICGFRFDVKAYRHMLSMTEALPWFDEDGERGTGQYHGTKV